MELLKAEAKENLEPPRCYIPIWVPIESPSERIQRAKDELTATATTEGLVEMSNDTSGKDMDGKKETDATGLSPSTKGNKSPKPKRERKKSKSKSGEEKSADEGEKIEKAEGLASAKGDSTEDSKSPMKKSPEKSSKSPKKSVGEEEKTPAKIEDFFC